MMRAKVEDRLVYDEGGVLIATCPNAEAAQYVGAALDLLAYVRGELGRSEDICIGVRSGEVAVGTLIYLPDGFSIDGRAKTLDAAVRRALEPQS